MATKTMNDVIGDVVKMEQPSDYSREKKTAKTGVTLNIGSLAYADSTGDMIPTGVAVDEVQTITPSVGANADEVHTITNDAAISAGELSITYYAPDGTPIPVSVAFNSSVAQTITDWNTKSTVAATVWAGEASVGAVLTSGDSGVTHVLTFSGVGFTNNPIGKLSLADISGTTGTTFGTPR